MRAVRISRDEIAAAGVLVSEPDRAEMAVPSYTHWNPMIRWLFWRRLDTAVQMANLEPGLRILDFGVGSGVLLQTLSTAQSRRIVGVDVLTGPASEMARRRGIDVEMVEARDFARFAEANRGAFDRIFALDVLEHVSEAELDALSGQYRTLLAPEGALLVSGPTESFAYKVGRLLAGFKGDYHHRNIFEIREHLLRTWTRGADARVPGWPLPRAFLISKFRVPDSGRDSASGLPRG
jgi:hypothetical protein